MERRLASYLGLGFTAVVLALSGSEAATEYATGYVVERSLSLDNLFVFALIFAALGIGPTSGSGYSGSGS